MQSKFSKTAFYLIILGIFIALFVCGYLIINSFKFTYLASPVLTLNENNKTISWKGVENAASYDIYLDSTLKDSVQDDGRTSDYVYNIASLVTNIKFCQFKVLAKPHKNQNKYAQNFSTVVNYKNTNALAPNNLPPVSSKTISVSNMEVSNNVLSWKEISGVENYKITISTNSGTKVATSATNSLDLKTYNLDYAIACFRVGYEQNGELVLGEQFYYNFLNNDSVGENFTKTIINFNDRYDDLYVTNEDEFINILYYMLIYKKELLTLKFSDSYMETIVGNSTGTSKITHFQQYFEDKIQNDLNETCAFTPSFTFVKGENNVVKLGFDFYKVYESSLTSERFVYTKGNSIYSTPNIGRVKRETVQNKDYKPYYENVSFTKRLSTYNNFASDKKIKQQVVSTTEELHWAVSHGCKPICVSGSSAEKMYATIKSVLRGIISDDMTDYEKVLSIYDYIAYNTVYDYNIIAKSGENAFTSVDVFNATKYNCFYLEGVFYDGLAVCDGFSKAFDIMCEMEGIECTRISGESDGGGHAWNKVKLNGNWYGVDITWTEIEGETNNGTRLEQIISHEYFLVSDNVLTERANINHTPYNKEQDALMPALNTYSYYSYVTYNVDGNNYSSIVKTQNDINRIMQFFNASSYNNIEILFTNTDTSSVTRMIENAKDYVGMITPLESVKKQVVHSGFGNINSTFIVTLRKLKNYTLSDAQIASLFC